MDLGFHNAGFVNSGLCEWDEWRRRLLAARFPGVPVHHDLAELADWCEAKPDEVREWCGGQPALLIGGTPCQDLSVAGKRAGLDGERSGLYYAYQRVRIALGIEWAVWENVAGALSSSDGLDFASVLGAFVGADVPVPAAGWSSSGVAAGPWGGCVWRVLDAQHFGVPQRRRRVFVVGRLGGACPPEVLLEPARSGRDSQASGQERPRVAAGLTRGSARPGVSEPGRRQEDDVNLVAGTVRSHMRPGSNDCGGIVNALDTQGGGPDDNSAQAGHLIAPALVKRYAKGTDSDATDALVVGPLVSGSSRGKPTPLSPGQNGADGHIVAHTLRAEGFDASEDGTGRGTPLTVVDAQGVGQDGRQDDGRGTDAGAGADQRLLLDGEPRERQQRGHEPDAQGGQRARHPVATSDAARIDGAPTDADGVRAADGLAGRLDVAGVKLSNTGSNGHNEFSDVAPTLDATSGRLAVGIGESEPFTFDWQMSSTNDKSWGGKSRAWIEDKPGTARSLGTTKTLAVFGASGEPGPACAHDPQPDGRRYAACGDGVVAPVAEWIGRRLAHVIETEVTHAASAA